MITSTSLNQIKEQIKQIIDTIELTINLPTGESINKKVFRQAEKSLKNILFRLQYALLQAEEEEDWELVDMLSEAIEQCQDALNAVRVSLFEIVLIRTDHDKIIADLRGIKQDIDTAIQAGKVLDLFISLARLVISFSGA